MLFIILFLIPLVYWGIGYLSYRLWIAKYPPVYGQIKGDRWYDNHCVHTSAFTQPSKIQEDGWYNTDKEGAYTAHSYYPCGWSIRSAFWQLSFGWPLFVLVLLHEIVEIRAKKILSYGKSIQENHNKKMRNKYIKRRPDSYMLAAQEEVEALLREN